LPDSALAVGGVALATIASAWIFQFAGYPPCDLCYEQRYAYYAGVPLAAALFALARGGAPLAPLRVGMALLALVFLANFVLAIYHSGVEAKLWQGPTACTASGALPASGADLLTQLQTVKVVRCDEVGLRVLGLSLANWNIFISGALAALAARALLLTR
jgi:disulfide bond formation protein DsbB